MDQTEMGDEKDKMMTRYAQLFTTVEVGFRGRSLRGPAK